MASAARTSSDLEAHQRSIRLPGDELVLELRDLLGATLVAYLGSVKETRAVRQWADGERVPSAGVLQRLRTAHYIAALLRQHDAVPVVQAWFQGMNPHLDDIPPARFLLKGQLEEAGPAVLSAARAFITEG